MAAIIGRITREKRERDLKLTKEIKSSQSPFVLKYFTHNFDPEIDNKERITNFSRFLSVHIFSHGVNFINVLRTLFCTKVFLAAFLCLESSFE